MSSGARGSLFDPKRIAINALDASAGRNYIRKQLTPMADPTSNIENILHAIERKPFAHQVKKIEIPPIIARIAEILGRMRIQGAKFVGHRGPYSVQRSWLLRRAELYPGGIAQFCVSVNVLIKGRWASQRNERSWPITS